MLDTYVYAMAAQTKYGCSWISAERWRELEMRCSGGGETTPSGKPVLDDRSGKRILEIVKQLP